MKVEKTTCPYCGANMKILPGQNSAECDYCGSTVLISGTETGTKKTASSNQQIPTENIEEPIRQTSVKHGIFPPPGFRSRNILHMITAVCGYLFIFYVAAELGSVLDFIFFAAASLSVIDICTDWTGFFSRLKGSNSSNQPVRILMKIVWSIAVFIAWVVLLAILQAVLNL